MSNTIKENVKITVVDHDRLTREFIVNVLMYCVNRDVQGLERGGQLTEQLAGDRRPDLILAEAFLPDISGFELMRNVKQQHPETVFVLMSDRPQDENQAARLGADAFLAKPFGIQDLFDLVQKFVVGQNH